MTARSFQGHGQIPSLQQGVPPPPEGTESGLRSRHLSLALPFCLFSGMGTAAGAPRFQNASPLGTPNGIDQYLSPFEKIHILCCGGLLLAWAALPKSREDRQSLSTTRAQRMQEDGHVALDPAHGRDPALCCSCALGLWGLTARPGLQLQQQVHLYKSHISHHLWNGVQMPPTQNIFSFGC